MLIHTIKFRAHHVNLFVFRTICVDFSQGNKRQFGQAAGKQCVAISLTAIIHTQVKDITTWDSIFLNTILSVGNNLYTCISKSLENNYCY